MKSPSTENRWRTGGPWRVAFTSPPEPMRDAEAAADVAIGGDADASASDAAGLDADDNANGTENYLRILSNDARTAATWNDAEENGIPMTALVGYVVEFE